MATKPHAFVAMPFGIKPGPDGTSIDFNRVYADYIAPALAKAGLEAFRADEETRAGDIRTDMFQELLVADLVIADLTTPNPNVWYELGVRHALRARGVVLVCGGSVTTAFDLYTDRKLRYGVKDGGPDPATVQQDIAALAKMIRDTMESWHGRKISPVYSLMPNLQEPDWKSLRIGNVNEFWQAHENWNAGIERARKAGQIGDLLTLADEAPVTAFRADAWIRAGIALRKLERFDVALEMLERGLAVEHGNRLAQREKGVCLQRLALAGAPNHSMDRARDHYRALLESTPKDPETWALLGRVDKDAWVAAWDLPDSDAAKMRADAAYEDALLRAAIESYESAFRAHPGHYYSGINALTLMRLHDELMGDQRYADEAAVMAGAIGFAATHEMDPGDQFYAKATLGDLAVLMDTPDAVRTHYKAAIAKIDGDWFALNSCRAQLMLLRKLGFRPEAVNAGIETFDRAMERLTRPADKWKPRQVILFSGHMVDAPDRGSPRFPADQETVAAKAIAQALDALNADGRDLALTQGAAGGDLLFLEACQARQVRCQLLLPFAEAEFIQRSILPSAGGDAWRQRYFAVKDKLPEPPREMPAALGTLPKDVDPFERCNLWLLYSALACGLDKVRFIALWNGGGADGPGGTKHMYDEVNRRTGRVTWLDTRMLFKGL